MIDGKKIGFLISGSLSKMEPEKACAILKQIGYDSVEWQVDALNPRKKTNSEIARVVDATISAGLEISEVVVQQDLVVLDEALRRKNINLINECLETYAQFGIKTINLYTGPVPWHKPQVIIGRDISTGAAWDMLVDSVRQILPTAETNGIDLAFENVWGMLCHDFYTMKYLFTQIDSPRLGVNLDPSHDVLAGNMDMNWLVRGWGVEKIKHVHLKDAVGTQDNGKFIFPLLGEGNVNWNDFFTALGEIGYMGTYSVEFESFIYAKQILGGDWETAARISFDQVRQLLENLEK